MQCGQCKFRVDPNMKYALMNNVCPSCGNGLFSADELKDITLLQKRMNGKPFASGLSEGTLFDIALYIIDEIKNGLGQKYLSKKSKEVRASEEELSEEDILKQIRQEVEKEVIGDESIYEEPDYEDEGFEDFGSDEDPENAFIAKAQASIQNKKDRLKHMSGKHKVTTVRRVDS